MHKNLDPPVSTPSPSFKDTASLEGEGEAEENTSSSSFFQNETKYWLFMVGIGIGTCIFAFGLGCLVFIFLRNRKRIGKDLEKNKSDGSPRKKPRTLSEIISEVERTEDTYTKNHEYGWFSNCELKRNKK